jgi:hypothetical protein
MLDRDLCNAAYFSFYRAALLVLVSTVPCAGATLLSALPQLV